MDSLDHTHALNYWVNTINHEGLRTENWTDPCALLVFPHCTHSQPYDRLDADLPTITRIRRFVEGGGSFRHARLEPSFRHEDVQRGVQRAYSKACDVEVGFGERFYDSIRSWNVAET
jgi:hypothetical protein